MNLSRYSIGTTSGIEREQSQKLPVFRQKSLLLPWHEATQNDVRSHVGKWRISGLVMLKLSFVDPDPLRTTSVIVSSQANMRGRRGVQC